MKGINCSKIKWFFIFWAYRTYSLIKLSYYRKHKIQINFVFVLNNLPIWKTERLYLAMLKHPRINPILAVTDNFNIPEAREQMVEYLNYKGYEYIVLDREKTIRKQLDANIVAYQRPYIECCLNHAFTKNLGCLFVSIPYGFHSMVEKWALDEPYYQYCIQEYYENELCLNGPKDVALNRGKNYVVTGSPAMEELMLDAAIYIDPWKNKDNRKRIIWAPHHTIGDIHNQGIAYGTFLDYADSMLELAEEFSDRVYWAFKPHPQLKKSLISYGWSKEKTENYYKRWNNLQYAQIEIGPYIGLFKHSDALIHDCATFTMEYLATGNPALYLVRGERGSQNVNECAQKSFDLHYHAYNFGDVRKFVENIIVGEDSRKVERMPFVEKYLRPPYGKTACQNIINAILGLEEYSNC